MADIEATLVRWSLSPRKLLAKRLPAEATVVDVGCGDLRKTYNYLYRTNPRLRIVGVELGVDQTQYGASEIPKNIERTGRFTRLACDVDKEPLPFADGSVDGVFCSHLIEHVEHQEHVLSQLFRVLRPGGLIYVETPGPRSLIIGPGSWLSKIVTANPVNYWDDPTHLAPPWNLEELSLRLIGAGFELLESGYHREAGALAIPLYACAFAAGLLPVLPRSTRGVLVGAGWWNLVGWPIWGLARKPGRAS